MNLMDDEKKVSQVEASLKRLSDEVSDLNNCLATLARRLESVLRNEPQCEGTLKDADSEERVHLANVLDEHASGVFRAKCIVNDFLRRLEL
jgi:septal ring factor EnvC (AmiA/AmiB activator)